MECDSAGESSIDSTLRRDFLKKVAAGSAMATMSRMRYPKRGVDRRLNWKRLTPARRMLLYYLIAFDLFGRFGESQGGTTMRRNKISGKSPDTAFKAEGNVGKPVMIVLAVIVERNLIYLRSITP